MSPITALRALAATALATSLALAQTPPPKAPAVQSAPIHPAPAPKEPEYVTSRGEFKSKYFVLNHRSPYALRNILRPLASGFKGTEFEATDRDGLKTLSVRDFPENLAAIEDALKRLDVAAPIRRQVELHIHVLFGSKKDGPNEEFPEELKDVLAGLKSTLKYRSYALATSFVQRAGEGSENLQGRAQTDAPDKAPKGENSSDPIGFDWSIRTLNVESAQDGVATLNLKGFGFNVRALRDLNKPVLAFFETDLSLKDAEKVVVGTSAIKDKGLIVVLTARVLK